MAGAAIATLAVSVCFWPMAGTPMTGAPVAALFAPRPCVWPHAKTGTPMAGARGAAVIADEPVLLPKGPGDEGRGSRRYSDSRESVRLAEERRSDGWR